MLNRIKSSNYIPMYQTGKTQIALLDNRIIKINPDEKQNCQPEKIKMLLNIGWNK